MRHREDLHCISHDKGIHRQVHSTFDQRGRDHHLLCAEPMAHGANIQKFRCQCIRNQIEHWNWVLIGSDLDRQTAQSTETAFELQLSTDIDKISQHLKNRQSGGHNVIISTYNSWEKCAGALKKVQVHPDLVIYDEAHRTVGIIDQEDSFKRCILDESFPCRVRLFMTATPKDVKVGDDELGDNEFKRDIFNSMNDSER